MQRVGYHKIFRIFRQTEQPIQNKLAKTQTIILAGAKLTFHMHEYFSSEDLDLSNATKFSYHFSHFSVICYAFMKISAEINK